MNFSLLPTIVLLLARGSHSLSVINNLTVSSDVLSEVFVNEIKSNADKVYTSGDISSEYDSKKCLSSLREIVKRFPSRDVAPFLDAWGSLPSGIISGNQYDIGNFDQCVKLSVSLNEANDIVKGQFCFATLPLNEQQQGTSWWALPAVVRTGICSPQTCSPELLTAIFKQSTSGVYGGVLSEISVGRCTTGQVPPLDAGSIVCITILSIFTALMVMSSIYDYLMTYFERKPVPVLLAFSILTNGKRLFAINTKKSRNSIDCLTGMRVLSTVWIMNHHSFSLISGSPMINSPDFIAYFFSWEFMPIYNASISVDTFFFMGGLLVAWIGFRDLDKTGGKMNVIMNIVHRYIRLTPVLAAGLLLAYSVNNLDYTGPFRDTYIAKNNCNKNNWWPVLLYIQNYYNYALGNCYDEAWYLAIDFQLYALSPLILIPMWKWGKKFAPVVLVLGLASIACVMGIYFSNDYTGMMLGVNLNEWGNVYTATHTRYAPWLVGFGLGYFLHKNRQATFHISKIVQLAAWIASFAAMILIVFGPYFSLNVYHTGGAGTVFEAAMYESLKRVTWALAHAWITFACYYGYGGIVDEVLSHPVLQPFGRLTYAWYMMHMAILRMHYGMTRTEIYFSVYNLFLSFWSAFGVTLLVSIYVVLVFESPILALEKFIFSKPKTVHKENTAQAAQQNVVAEQPNVVAEQPNVVAEQPNVVAEHPSVVVEQAQKDS